MYHFEWYFVQNDLEVINKDWELINKKIADGKAHELSEGDTFYLGACTKGGKGGNPRPQPKNDILAKQRAYSLKQGYVNHIIASIAGNTSEVYGKLIPSLEVIEKQTIDEIVISKFAPYLNLSVEEIIQKIGIKLNPKAKNFYASITKAILGIELNEEIEEFQKAEIKVKTIRVEEDNSIQQSVSFPAFDFERIHRERWLESELKELSESKFLFIFLKKREETYYLEKLKFWNMPYTDRNEVRRVWLKTKKVIRTGKIIKEIKTDKSGKRFRLNFFPKKTENNVAHVRPHGSDARDTYPLPVPEQFTGAKKYSKQCFWLNWDYIRDEIYLKRK